MHISVHVHTHWRHKNIIRFVRRAKAGTCFRLPRSWPVNEGGTAGTRCLGNVCSRRRQRCQFSRRISRKRQSFRSDSSKWRGPLFLPLVSIPLSYIPRFQTPVGSSSRLGTPRGRRLREESIMELFKFVSNIEISFIPGELIIEVYRRTRRRERTSYARDGDEKYGSVGREEKEREREKWTFCFSPDYCFLLPQPIQDPSLSFALVHLAARRTGTSLSRRALTASVQFRASEKPRTPPFPSIPFSFSHRRRKRLANRRKIVALKAATGS